MNDENIVETRLTPPHVGQFAYDIPLYNLDAMETRLFRLLGEARFLLFQFGSLTCPYCFQLAPQMDALYVKLRSRGIEMMHIYTQEAHPGERYPAVSSFEAKIARAKHFMENLHICRPVLVDTFEETGHNSYGGGPNTCWIMDATHRLVFRTNWGTISSISQAVEHLLDQEEQRAKEDHAYGYFISEIIHWEPQDPDMYQERLRAAGPTALLEAGRRLILMQKARAVSREADNSDEHAQ